MFDTASCIHGKLSKGYFALIIALIVRPKSTRACGVTRSASARWGS